MTVKKILSLIIAACFLSGTALADDDEWYIIRIKKGKNEKPASFIETTVHGVGLGFAVGLAAGWVRYYPGKYETQNMWVSSGYGAYSGLGLGLAAAIIGKNGTGDLFITDIDRASGITGGIGFFAGVVSALFTGESERVGSGLAWGELGGAAIGIGLGTYKIAAGKYKLGNEKDKDTKASLRLFKDSKLNDYPVVCLEHRF